MARSRREQRQRRRQERRALREQLRGDDPAAAAAAAARAAERKAAPAAGSGARADGAPSPSAPSRPGGPAPWRRWGDRLDAQSLQQMEQAVSLPVAVAGALMPDAHVGYGLPIGGVLATEQAVIPYAVGVDIACRMRLSVLDWPAQDLQRRREDLRRALLAETRFGTGAAFEPGTRRDHPVLQEDWSFCPPVRENRDLAWQQLGSSGSGNHFVEFGRLELARPELGLPAGTYLALLSHSGSRHAGLQVANFYSRLAAQLHPELPPPLRRLAWLDLRTDPGQEYWQAMQLMGRYAAASHELIHRHVLRALGADALASVENHHNFAWLEEHGGREVVVHRKGATPATAGELGVIPGSMATPGWVVRGLGSAASLRSASHGAGRAMSRAQARKVLRAGDVRRELAARGVEVLGADLDEAPAAYKDIGQVMAAQSDLVEAVARFDPVLVRMAGRRLAG